MFGHGLNKNQKILHTCANVQNAIILGTKGVWCKV